MAGDILENPGDGTNEQAAAWVEMANAAQAEKEQNQEQERDPRVESLAIPLARDYAEKNYPMREDGTFEPAWRAVDGNSAFKNKSPEQLKKTGIKEIDDKEGRVFDTLEEAQAAVVDIANTPYNEYPEHWKEQNRGGAEFLISLVDDPKIGRETILAQDFVNDENAQQTFGDLVHNNWLKRNEWAKNDPDLGKPYAELSPKEQQKDIDQLIILQKWLLEQAAGETEA